MQKALAREPQVAIILNLAPQLSPGGFMVPEKIAIDAYLSDLGKEISSFSSEPGDDFEATLSETERIFLGRVFELTVDTVVREQLTSATPGGLKSFAPVVLQAPRDTQAKLHALLTTTVTVFDSIVLRERDSGLTHPTILHDLGAIKAGDQIEFRYCIDGEPGFKYRVLPA